MHNRRHNTVKFILADFLASIFGRPNITEEFVVEEGDTPADRRVFDIRASVSAFSAFYFDITIVNPSCTKYTNENIYDLNPDTASSFAETLKRTKYDKPLQDVGSNQESFIPFVIEATGRFGRDANHFLSETLRHSTNMEDKVLFPKINFLKRRIRASIAKYNAKLHLEMLANSETYWKPPRPNITSQLGPRPTHLSTIDDEWAEEPHHPSSSPSFIAPCLNPPSRQSVALDVMECVGETFEEMETLEMAELPIDDGLES